jgi:N-6 DNA methylase
MRHSAVMANPPFAGSLDYESCAKDLQQVVKTKKTELLFLALFLRLLKPGGRTAVIVPDGVLFGSSNAHKTLRRVLIEEQKLDAVVLLPGGVFKPRPWELPDLTSFCPSSAVVSLFHRPQISVQSGGLTCSQLTRTSGRC